MKRSLCAVAVTWSLTGCGEAPKSSGHSAGPPPSAAATVSAPKEKDGDKTGPNVRVVFTSAAAEQARKLLAERKAPYVRVSVSDDFQYKLDFAAKTDPADEHLEESQGVPVVVDRRSAALLSPGIIVDFEGANGDAGFKFRTDDSPHSKPVTKVSLSAARRGFKTKLGRKAPDAKPAAVPPPEMFRIVHYDTQLCKMVAYLSPDPQDGKQHPVIIWITGGDCNSIDEGCWRVVPRFDQSASAYRKAGTLMMFPGLRGGNDNPGANEGYLGEVDDVLAAVQFLHTLPFIDPYRIYIGGHSTGGTLALLAAECSDDFRAVFAFGAVSDVSRYEPTYNPFAHVDMSQLDPREIELRAPGRWLESIHSPVFVIDGTHGNVDDLRAMEQANKNPNVHFFAVGGTDHFRLLTPINALIAQKVHSDTGPTCNLSFTLQEMETPFVK
jgi:Fe-S cluster assembly iron-binding protein IscA/glutaredoxin